VLPQLCLEAKQFSSSFLRRALHEEGVVTLSWSLGHLGWPFSLPSPPIPSRRGGGAGLSLARVAAFGSGTDVNKVAD
jgi:hypothetical protein